MLSVQAGRGADKHLNLISVLRKLCLVSRENLPRVMMNQNNKEYVMYQMYDSESSESLFFWSFLGGGHVESYPIFVSLVV